MTAELVLRRRPAIRRAGADETAGASIRRPLRVAARPAAAAVAVSAAPWIEIAIPAALRLTSGDRLWRGRDVGGACDPPAALRPADAAGSRAPRGHDLVPLSLPAEGHRRRVAGVAAEVVAVADRLAGADQVAGARHGR